MRRNRSAAARAVDASTGPSLRVGCAGWGLDANVAASFPARGSHLERYAQVFSSVEINSSFYRAHQPKTYARWADSVPDAFHFSVKMPRAITHEARLRDCEEALCAFLAETAHLGSKLGCILVQLPPSLELDIRTATRFFSMLRDRTPVAVACEPRHESWFTPRAAALLHSACIAMVRADPSPVPAIDGQSGDMSTLYIRLHGTPKMYYSCYDDAFLAAIAAQMRHAKEQNRTAWCIFDNTAAGAATPNALTLMSKLSG